MNFMIKHICKNFFKKMFSELGDELKEDVNNILIGIRFEKGNAIYEAYKKQNNVLSKAQQLDIDDYFDLSGGNEIIKSTISQSGRTYANELKCDEKCVLLLMRHRDGKLPMTTLIENGEIDYNNPIDISLMRAKIKREINLQTEF